MSAATDAAKGKNQWMYVVAVGKGIVKVRDLIFNRLALKQSALRAS